jgi:nicotinate phosphoribosyltransferase
VTSSDAPFLDAVYKLQEYDGRPRRKRSAGKATWPGRKQVYRYLDAAGRFARDVVTAEADAQAGEPLLEPVMRAGRRLRPLPPLAAARDRAREQLERLPAGLRGLADAQAPYPVEIAPALRALAAAVDAVTGGE